MGQLFIELMTMTIGEIVILFLYLLFCSFIIGMAFWCICSPGIDDYYICEGYYEPDPDCSVCEGTGFVDKEKTLSCMCTDRID